MTALLFGLGYAVEPNPPSWPPSVQVFGPGDNLEDVTTIIRTAYARNGGHSPAWHGQFSSGRFAFLFKPGTYYVDVPVGYYTQVVGLGQRPDEVVFESRRGVYCEEGNQHELAGSLNTFWRSAENFRTRASHPWYGETKSNKGMLWAVSQASPLRRIIVDKNLMLSQEVHGVGAGWSSGGFMANMQVEGEVRAGTQQQFLTRNSKLGGWKGSNWNYVFVGTEGAPSHSCGSAPVGPLWHRILREPAVTVDKTPVIAEKPFITYDAVSGRYALQIPSLQRDRRGPDFGGGQRVDFEQVYVASDADNASAINAKLRAGLHVVLSPGIYQLEAPLELVKDNQVILGLGLATLVAAAGTAAVRVGNVDGARLAGLLLDAGPVANVDALLEWGDGRHKGDPANPGLLHDVFVRVGGPTDAVRARDMVHISSSHVIGDNLWLWRADHGNGKTGQDGANPCDVGVVVSGDDVTMYGLAVEHALKDQVRWSGERGRTFFFQCELPYDVTQAFGDAGYVGYRVLDGVTSHQAYGVGVYHFFRDHEVTVQRAIAVPKALEGSIVSPIGVFLSGLGRVRRVLNGHGTAVGKGLEHTSRVCLAQRDRPHSLLGRNGAGGVKGARRGVAPGHGAPMLDGPIVHPRLAARRRASGGTAAPGQIPAVAAESEALHSRQKNGAISGGHGWSQILPPAMLIVVGSVLFVVGLVVGFGTDADAGASQGLRDRPLLASSWCFSPGASSCGAQSPSEIEAVTAAPGPSARLASKDGGAAVSRRR